MISHSSQAGPRNLVGEGVVVAKGPAAATCRKCDGPIPPGTPFRLRQFADRRSLWSEAEHLRCPENERGET